MLRSLVYLQQGNVKKSKKVMKIVNIDEETLHKETLSLDLTKRRYNLLKIAQGIVKEMDNVSFVCADANCSLAIRFKNGTIKHFNSEYEFRSLLNDN